MRLELKKKKNNPIFSKKKLMILREGTKVGKPVKYLSSYGQKKKVMTNCKET